jgi:Ca-activated chloride channel family protein
MLKQIAGAAGGMYQPLGQQAQGLETLYRDGLSKFTKHDITSRMRKVYLERFQWPLALGLLCLVLEPIIGIRKRRAVVDARVSAKTALLKPVIAKVSRRLTPAATVAAALALLALPSFAHASAGSAEKAYAKGQFDQAAQEYQKAAEKTPKKPELQFNRGAAAYKAGQHEVAAEAFAKAMKTDNVPLQQDNYYNLGNTWYRLGQKTEKSNPQETIKTWEEAVKSYEVALQLKTDDADAEYNRDLVKKKLEELKKQQEQQKQDQKQDQQNQQDQKEQKDQQNQDKQQNQDNKQNSDQKQDQKDQDKKDDQQNQQDKQNQGKQDDKKDQSDKQSGNSGQQDKQDQKDGKDQDKPKDQQAKSGTDKDPSKPDEQKNSPEKEKRAGFCLDTLLQVAQLNERLHRRRVGTRRLKSARALGSRGTTGGWQPDYSKTPL